MDFCRNYVSETTKKDGVLGVEVFNTAFRPSINTPMERMPVSLFPEARRENLQIAKSDGINIKYTHLIQGAWMHLADVIAIRYNENQHGVIDFISTDEKFAKKNNADKMKYFLEKFEIDDYIREYSWDEPFISDLVKTEKSDQIRRSGEFLLKKLYK